MIKTTTMFCHQLKVLTFVSSFLISSRFFLHLKKVIKSNGIQNNKLIKADEYSSKLNNIIISVISTKITEKSVQYLLCLEISISQIGLAIIDTTEQQQLGCCSYLQTLNLEIN